MSKQKARARRRAAGSKRRSQSRRKSVIVIGLILSLGVTSLILAGWGSLRKSFSQLVLAPSPTPTPQLSKEYIYGGGRLVATEEPANTSTPLLPPTNFSAKADSTTQVTLKWGATGATSYVIERSTNYTATDHGFSLVGTKDCSGGCSGEVSYSDTTVPANMVATYLYRVRSASGPQQSPPSVIDFATTKSFPETISNQGQNRTAIKASHFTELKEAVDAVRHAVGLASFNWSDLQGRVPVSGGPILRSHLKDLRDALDQALTALGFTPQSYSDAGSGTTAPPVGTPVRKAHIDELRQRTKCVPDSQ